MKRILCLIFMIGLFIKSNAQKDFSTKASQIHLEFLGPGSMFSINYDSRFGNKEIGLGYRIGLGGTPLGLLGKSCNSGTLLTIPLGLTYLAGNTNHLLEIGAGGVVGISNATKVYCLDFDSDFFSDETVPYGYISAGYRYQPVAKKGLTYRIFISPLFQAEYAPKFWGGASIGYRW
jgi:hypothetical protein